MRVSMQEFGSRAPDPSVYRLAVGADATKAAVVAALPDADVMMLGTHGEFGFDDLELTRVVLAEEPFTMADMLAMPELKKRALLVLLACETGAVAPTPDDRTAWGIPGALLSAGASSVLANLWPVEDISSNLLRERFLAHLGHRGYRPSAALFRAVRDLRQMPRDRALLYCRQHFDRLKQAHAPPRVLVGTRSLLQWIEDEGGEYPFAHPYFWGATAIFGSGWHLPAGASVGSPQLMIENTLALAEAEELAVHRRPREALELAQKIAAHSDGSTRGRAYTAMALALLHSSDLSSEARLKTRSVRLLRAAARIADGHGDDALRQRVQWIQAEMGVEDVVKSDG